MLNPIRIRNLGIVMALVGTAGVTYCVMRGNGKDSVSGFSGLIGATLVILGLGTAIGFRAEVRRYRRLLRGEGVLARWTISPEGWHDFLVYSARLDKTPGNDPCLLPGPTRPPARPVEVIITEDGLLLAGVFHELRRTGNGAVTGPLLVPGPPAHLHYHFTYTGAEYSDYYERCLRIPITSETDLAALNVQPA